MGIVGALNWWAVLLAAIVSFVFGGLWYGLLSKQWMAAAGLTEEQIRGTGGPSPMPFIITFIAQVVMAAMLAGILFHLALGGMRPALRVGLIAGFLVWLGFVATTLVVNQQCQMQKASLTLIDGAHWLGVLLLQGAILGLMLR